MILHRWWISLVLGGKIMKLPMGSGRVHGAAPFRRLDCGGLQRRSGGWIVVGCSAVPAAGLWWAAAPFRRLDCGGLQRRSGGWIVSCLCGLGLMAIGGKRGCVEFWMYAVGMGLAVMMGGALGGSLAKEHGARRVFPIVVPLTLAIGLVLGWALNGWIAFTQESAFH